jgi:hypothetical protein
MIRMLNEYSITRSAMTTYSQKPLVNYIYRRKPVATEKRYEHLSQCGCGGYIYMQQLGLFRNWKAIFNMRSPRCPAAKRFAFQGRTAYE